MQPLLPLTQSVAPLAAQLLVTSVWQGILLTAGVGLCLRMLPGVPAALRSAIWTAVLLLVLLLPGFELSRATTATPTLGAFHADLAWGRVLLAVWAGAALLRGARLVYEAVRLHGVVRRATPVAAPPALAALLEAARGARLCLSGEVNRPGVLGLWRPSILLPQALFASLSEAELEQVILHETAHLRRYDDWINLLQGISLALLPLHPALFWLDRQLSRERELACDDRVLRATRARRAYAACLVKLAEDSMLRRGVSAALSALGPRAGESELVRRVRRILAGQAGGTVTRRMRLGATSVVGLAVLLAGMLAGSPELLQFDGAPSLEAAVMQPQRAPFATPLSAANSMRTVSASPYPGVRPVLTRAVLQQPSATLHRVSTAGVRRRVTKGARLHGGVDRVRTWTGLPGLRSAPMPAARIVVTEMEVSQPLYAAVPWRDGWLLVQL